MATNRSDSVLHINNNSNNNNNDDSNIAVGMHAAGEDSDEDYKSVNNDENLDCALSSTQNDFTHDGDDATSNRTLVADLLAHLADEDLSDVILKGTDGRTVVAIRSILAMRSRFFKSLLFGEFSESTMATVPLGYSSLVLRAVVEYCYTDEIKTTFENLTFEETARSMVGLVAAGNYFELGGLLGRAYRLTCLMMDEYPALACSVLDEAISGENKGTHTDELSRVALGIIRLRTESALMPRDLYGSGVDSLGEAAMELVMSDEKIQTNELKLFCCLKKWSEHVPDGQNADEVSKHRRQVASELACHIDFAKVAPSDLSTIVADSGIVPLELMCLAYKTQALEAERKGVVFDRMRAVEHATNGRVMVQGAGLSAVNGTYKSLPTKHTQLQQYSRKGVLPEFGAGVFVLHTLTMQDDTKKWLLSFQYKHETSVDLYSAPVLFDEIIPPMQKWVPCSSAHERLRRIASRNKLSQRKEKKNHASFVSGESEDYGDPPPICIWLPDDPSDR
ncbi:BTB/POZ domain containing protein [Fragilaria crotonensis]|nr:BTB/POZ domain containing protein [Fragilaria crotonensis]